MSPRSPATYLEAEAAPGRTRRRTNYTLTAAGRWRWMAEIVWYLALLPRPERVKMLLMAIRQVAVLVFPQVQAIDVFGPVEVFSAANRLAGGGEYEIELISPRAGSIEMSSGVRVSPDRAVSAVREPLDTLIVAGGDGVVVALEDGRLVRWVAREAGRSRRVCAVCTGAFLLAEAGLLDGRRATTHWAACEELALRYPAVIVDPAPIFIRDGGLATPAGVTAGIDLALSLVEEDLGPELARDVARWLVLFLRRRAARPNSAARWTVLLPTVRRSAWCRSGSPDTWTTTSRSPPSPSEPR